ncbi:tetratricopeptide repeat-containing sensor histidine kinase [Flagellimonas algicola]|uniref:Sensor histidine kinase n=1 Tax=Flagellimonas algicola TaxID=2583815 RepID=A0ABY2WHN4_9FLAO|nr:histidine kinase [Allomuricauda algicola]TMU54344.1 sensor histidine kinase [Allomuricauda algicola]
MVRSKFIVFLCSLFTMVAFSQQQDGRKWVEIKGSVKGKENYEPISGVDVSTDSGYYTTTNSLGEFRIRAAIGDMLIFESGEFETARHRITSEEDVDVLVEGYAPSRSSKKEKKLSSISRKVENHQRFLDSANQYKRTDLEKSIDFIAQSISQLGKRGNKTELSNSLTALGEIYLYHQQYDLAISSFKDALTARRTVKIELLLGQAHILNGEFEHGESMLAPLVDVNGLVPYQRIEIYEGLGDANKGLGDVQKALEFYQEALQIAEKNQISPKVIDLNSKIADTYARDNRLVEAEGFFANSLNLSKQVAPERQIQENEKVADFYNEKNRYEDEIQLRKQSLNELQQLPSVSVNKDNATAGLPDSITSQQINYKIGRAYIAQDKLDEAIPYLQKSIVEADSEDDLVVQKDATRRLSEAYRYKGDFAKALETYQDYVAVVDSLYARKEQEISRAARLNREIATKQNRISSLEQERELSQSKYSLALTEQQLFEEASKRQKWIIYSLIFGMVLMALTAFLFYRNNQQQKLANNLLALKSLRTQMNPHFIFNALNSVNNFIAKSDERSANRFLSDFSVLMRSVLENSEEDFIPLPKELELLELYVRLEHSRFSDKFDFSIEVDDNIDVEAFEIPPMLLQPYIENAIWHGLRYKEEKGFLKINVSEVTKDKLKIVIEDDGIGRKRSAALKTENQKKQKSKGMGNIKKRIQILNDMYKNKVEVSIADLKEDQTGTRVTLNLRKD